MTCAALARAEVLDIGPLDDTLTHPRNPIAKNFGTWDGGREDRLWDGERYNGGGIVVDRLEFRVNGFKGRVFNGMRYSECFGGPFFHAQHIVRMRNKNGRAYFMVSNSDAYVPDTIFENSQQRGYLSVYRSDSLDPVTDLVPAHKTGVTDGEVVWEHHFDPYSAIGEWNHPCKMDLIGNLLLVNTIDFNFDACRDGFDGHEGALLFYDVRDPENPRFWGRMTRKDLGIELNEGYSKVEEVSLVQQGDEWILIAQGTWWRTKNVSPDIAQWTKGGSASVSGNQQGQFFNSYEVYDPPRIAPPRSISPGTKRVMWGNGEGNDLDYGNHVVGDEYLVFATLLFGPDQQLSPTKPTSADTDASKVYRQAPNLWGNNVLQLSIKGFSYFKDYDACGISVHSGMPVFYAPLIAYRYDHGDDPYGADKIYQIYHPANIVAPISLEVALNNTALTWGHQDTTPWSGQNIFTRGGEGTAQSGAIGNSASSKLSTIIYGPGELTFWWKVSSEINDKLSFVDISKDSASVPTISGDVDWQKVTVPLPAGRRSLIWTYSKDASGTAGADAGFVDRVSFTATLRPEMTVNSGSSLPPPYNLSDEFVSLGEALQQIQPGGVIRFSSGGPYVPGTRHMSFGTAIINKSVTLDASDLPLGLALQVDHLTIESGVTVVLKGGITVVAGTSSDRGGGFLNYGNLILQNTTVLGGFASLDGDRGESDGGAIFNEPGATLTVIDSTFSNNRASRDGGAIYNAAGATLTIISSTFSGNSARSGGAIQNYGAMTLDQVTLSGNTATIRSGGLDLEGSARLNIRNTLIAGNSAPTSPDIGGQGASTIVSSGANLIGNNASVTASFPAGPLVGTAARPLDARLAPLGDNGGTTETMRLLPGSPALDAGATSESFTDQRGFPRTRDGDAIPGAIPDIGAYEAGAAPFMVGLNLVGRGGTLAAADTAGAPGFRQAHWNNLTTDFDGTGIGSPLNGPAELLDAAGGTAGGFGVSSGASVIADSVADFGGTQGLNGWSYGYYDITRLGGPPKSPNDLTLFPNTGAAYSALNYWDGTLWDWFAGNQPWTEISATGGHPNGSNQSNQHWVVRRYQIQPGEEGDLWVNWSLSKSNPNWDGTSVRVLLNGAQIDFGSVAGSDLIGINRSVRIGQAKAGDTIDIALTPEGPGGDTTDFSDGSNFGAIIRKAQPVVQLWWDAPSVQGKDPATLSTPDAKLMGGYLDSNGTTGGVVTDLYSATSAQPFLAVGNLPAAATLGGYRAVVYVDGNAQDGRIGKYWLTSNYGAIPGNVTGEVPLTPASYHHDSTDFSGSYVRNLTADLETIPAPGNFLVFNALSDSGFIVRAEEVNASGGAQTGDGARAPINAVQIVRNEIVVVTTAQDELDPTGTLGAGLSLREALRDAPSGAGILFDPAVFDGSPAATITLTGGQLVIREDLTIDAGNLASRVTIDATGVPQGAFFCVGKNRVAMTGLTLIGASGPASIGIQFADQLALNSVAISGFGGGGISGRNSTLGPVLTLDHCTVSGSKTGPGIAMSGQPYLHLFGNLSVRNSTLSGNSALTLSDLAGGINGDSCNVRVANSTLSGNSGGTGGGINARRSHVTLDNVTVVGNKAASTANNVGGSISFVPLEFFSNGVLSGQTAMSLQNVIVAGNTAPASPEVSGSFAGSNNFIGGDPKLALLADFGGPNQTMPPLTGSPIIEAGGLFPGTPPTDQRGSPRPRAVRPNIGAVEGNLGVIASLAGLAPSVGTLTPGFASTTTAYSLQVDHAAASITFLVNAVQSEARIAVNGLTATSGTASRPIGLEYGANLVTIVVTAQDGTTVKTYVVTVTRAVQVSGIQDVTQPGDRIVGTHPTDNSPPTEQVANAIDNDQNTKHLNFAKLVGTVPFGANTGFTVIPGVGESVVTGVALTSANDSPERDPRTYKLEGSGDGVVFTVIGQGAVPVFGGRFVRQVISFANSAPYTSYRLTFPTVADATRANSMQIAEVELLGTTSAGLPPLSNNAELTALALGAGTISPAFAGAVTAYAASVPNATSSVTVAPTAAQANATIKVNGVTVNSGTPSSAINLAVGSNSVTIAVTAQDGSTVKNYVVTVTRGTAPVEGTPGLNRLFYRARPGVTLAAFYFGPRGKGVFPAGAAPVGTGPTQSGTVAKFEAPAEVGEEYGQILHGYIVPSESANYTFYLCSDDQGELWLSTDDNPINSKLIATEPEYNPARTWNSADRRPVANGRRANVSASVRLEAGKYYYVEAVMKEGSGGDNLGVAWTRAGAPMPANGSEPIPGANLRTRYQPGTVVSSNADLANLVSSAGSLTPGFGSAVTAYTVSVPNAIGSMTFLPTAAQANATVRVNGATTPSGAASGAINLAVGSNAITIAVTAQDATTVKTYVVTVLRADVGPTTKGYAQLVREHGAVGYWRLGESTGDIARDEIGAKHGLLLNGVTLGVAGALAIDSNTAARFRREALQKVDVAWSATLNPPEFSAEVWARVTGSIADHRSPLTSRAEGPERGYIFYAEPGNTWQFWTGKGDFSGWDVIPGPAVEPEKWTHLVATYDGTTKRFFVNAIEVGISTAAFGPNDENPLRFGGGGTEGDGNYFFEGDVDEPAIYNKALTRQQILQHYLTGVEGTAATAELSIRYDQGQIVILYTGTLQSASHVAGPYSVVSGATSPFTVAPNNTAMFYIAR
ncbi:MAG: cadherin-like beta sandwich domain-containing protein [Limisphaerales bacterium]